MAGSFNVESIDYTGPEQLEGHGKKFWLKDAIRKKLGRRQCWEKFYSIGKRRGKGHQSWRILFVDYWVPLTEMGNWWLEDNRGLLRRCAWQGKRDGERVWTNVRVALGGYTESNTAASRSSGLAAVSREICGLKLLGILFWLCVNGREN